MMAELWRLSEELWFPAPEQALSDPEGLLAIGGDLSPERLMLAYQQGTFPWYNPGEEILWWCPAQRMVLNPEHLHISRSLQRRLKRNEFHCTWNQAFAQVMQLCATVHGSSWITEEMKQAYQQLQQLGHAHSIEVWQDERLVGGLYGVAWNGVFFAESMFHLATDASKVALVFLCQRLREQNVRLIDCQFYTAHLASLGAVEISREEFLAIVRHP